MKKVNHIESSVVDLSIYGSLLPQVEFRLHGALQGTHPLELSYGHTERWICEEEGEPVGLLLISVIPDLRVGVIEKLFVKPEREHQGIATLLLQSSEITLKSLNIEAVSFYYPVNTGASPALEKLGAQFCAHQPSKPFVRKFHFFVPDFHPTWLKRDLRVPEGYSLIRWDELTERENATLQQEFEEKKIPDSLNPFHHPELLCKECNVAIRSSDGVIAAWMVCHFVKEGEVEFSSLYERPSLSKLGLGIMVLQEAILRLQQMKVPYASMTIRLHEKTKGTWSHFIQKRLAPFALEMIEIHESFVMLSF